MTTTVKSPHFAIGTDVMCIDDRPWPNLNYTIEVELYRIYRVANISGDVYLEGLNLGYNKDRFIDVTDWSEAEKVLNRA